MWFEKHRGFFYKVLKICLESQNFSRLYLSVYSVCVFCENFEAILSNFSLGSWVHRSEGNVKVIVDVFYDFVRNFNGRVHCLKLNLKFVQGELLLDVLGLFDGISIFVGRILRTQMLLRVVLLNRLVLLLLLF